MKGEKTLELTSILQGPDEPYQEFVAHLLQSIGRIVADAEAINIKGKQLYCILPTSAAKAVPIQACNLLGITIFAPFCGLGL
jgi:hypothetical protein